jgi:vacuolar-type H+-ATPase subunit H
MGGVQSVPANDTASDKAQQVVKSIDKAGKDTAKSVQKAADEVSKSVDKASKDTTKQAKSAADKVVQTVKDVVGGSDKDDKKGKDLLVDTLPFVVVAVAVVGLWIIKEKPWKGKGKKKDAPASA